MTDVIIIGKEEQQPLPPDPRWARHAACIGLNDLFFPGQGESTTEAKAICASCPVLTECREHAMTQKEKFGVWGGMSENQRKAARSGHPRTPRPLIPIEHGTRRGYKAEVRRHLEPCRECAAANYQWHVANRALRLVSSDEGAA